MPDLYDRWQANPGLIERLENSLGNKITRGGSFKFPPVHIVEIPDRAVLRENMRERYGIENIDSYFIPVVVDTLTYRQLMGVPEPSIWDGFDTYSKLMSMTEGHVKKANGHYISYISANLPLDMGVEHEGIHAYMFKHNMHYAKYAPTLGYGSLLPAPVRDHSWLEAVPWVATLPDVDLSDISETYTPGSTQPTLLRYAISMGRLTVALSLGVAIDGYKKVKGGHVADVPFLAAQKGLLFVHGATTFGRDKATVLAQWKRSFDVAKQLKEKCGVKEFVRLAGTKHQDELERLV